MNKIETQAFGIVCANQVAVDSSVIVPGYLWLPSAIGRVRQSLSTVHPLWAIRNIKRSSAVYRENAAPAMQVSATITDKHPRISRARD